MICEFKDESLRCFQTKSRCLREDFKACKYYLRQKPLDESLFKVRFKKALTKALNKRDLFEQYEYLANQPVDTGLTIFENVQLVLEKIETPTLIRSKRRQLTEEDLQGNILQNITSNLYEDVEVRIIQKDPDKNTLIISEGSEKYLCRISLPLKAFFEVFLKADNQVQFLDSQIVERSKIG